LLHIYLIKERVYSLTKAGFSLFATTVLMLLLLGQKVIAQSPTISYPSSAQDLTRGYSQSNLTVKLVFNGVCSGTVRLGFPASITYVAGSVVKTGGSAGVSISESSLSDLSKPTFSISGVSSIGDEITFTVARRAGCGSLASAKDSVYFISGAGCSDASEVVGTVNTYNILAPALSISPAAALTGAVVGNTYSRTSVITNGGNGATDTVRFYIVYPSGGIVNSSGTNAITANGVSFTPSSTSGDTLFYKFFGATIFGVDNLLTSGETVNVVEPIRVVKCNTTTAYATSWGRNDVSICQIATGTSNMTMAVGVPNLVQTSHTVVKKTNMCDSAIIIATIRNNGTESVAGAGTAFNLIQYIGMAGGESMFSLARIDLNISELELSDGAGGWIPLTYTGGSPLSLGTAPIPAAANLSLITSDPDGAGRLIDADGDGQFDDLAVGQQFQIRYKVGYVCRPGCAVGNHSGSPAYRTDFSNQCGTSVTGTQVLNSSNAVYGNRVQTASSLSGPSDISDGEIVTIRFTGGRDFTALSSGFVCATNQLIWRIAVPKGFSLSAGRYYNATSTLSTISTSSITSGATHDTLIIVGSNTDSYNPFAFEADLQLNCAAYVAPGPISYTVTYVCETGCGCQEVWYCGNIGLNPHCGSPCPDGGLTMTSSRLRRTTGGYTSATSSTFVSVSGLTDQQLKYTMPYDTVLGRFSGNYYAGTVGHSFVGEFFEFKYTAVGAAKVLEAYNATVRVYNPTTLSLLSTCSLAAPTTSSIASGVHTILYDLTSCGVNPGDSIVVEPIFSVLNNASLPTTPTLLAGIATRLYSTVAAGTQYTCDAWSAEYYVNRPGISRFDGTGPITNNGCNTYTYTSTLTQQNSGIDVYPNETRNAIEFDSIKVEILNGDFLGGSYNLFSFGNGISEGYATGSGTNTVLTPTSISADGKTAVFENTGYLWPKGEILNAINAGYRFTATFINGCGSAPSGNVRLTYYYKLFSYAQNPSVRTATNSVSSRVIANTVPNITVQNNSGTVQGVNVAQHWDVQINNPSAQTAPFIWMALEQGAGSGNIIVDSVKLLPSLTTISPTSTYNGTDKWYQISTAGLASGASQQARVFFRYTSCNADSILLKSGWNCSGYPTPNPLSYPCTASSTYLKVEPQPSQVQLSVLRQPGGGSSINLCSTDSTIIVLNSAQSANLLNPYITFYPPAGLSLVTPIRVEYPRGSGNYQNAVVTSLVGGGYQIDLSAHTGIGSKGILGTANASPSYVPLGGDREARVAVTFTTACEYTSGTSLKFNAYGSRPCGLAATDNGVAITTAALNITGATAAGGAGVTISFGGGATSVNCGSSLITLSLITTPTSLGTTSGDTMSYTLPIGLVYAGNLTAGYSAVVTGGSGAPTIVKIPMPVGVAASTPINYSFDVEPNGGGCGAMNISGDYKRLIAPLSCGAVPCASSSVVIASATSPVITVNKPTLILNNVEIFDTTAWRQANYPANRVRVYYSNNGTQSYTGNSDTVEFFCNSASTVPFAKMPLTKNVAIGASDSDEHYVMMPIGSCSPGDVITTRIQTQTAGGTAQCLCAPSSFEMAGVGLPLKFLSTKIQSKDCAVNLNWQYNDQSSLIRYEVERSSDGKNYHRIAQLHANNNEYLDVTPTSGIWFYRIKVIEAEGSVTYSNTLSTQTSKCIGTANSVYPNPASDQIYIVLQGESFYNQFQIIDALGRTLLKGSLNMNTNNKINVANLVSGTYTIRIITDTEVSTQQVQILR